MRDQKRSNSETGWSHEIELMSLFTTDISITIREATLDDLDDVIELYRSMYHDIGHKDEIILNAVRF